MLPIDRPYIIGETAFHHEGNVDFLKELIKSGVSCGVDALKFHLLFDLDDYIIPEHKAVDILKNISIQEEEWNEVINTIDTTLVDIIFLCNDIKSLKWVNSIQNNYKIKAIELHSTGLNDLFLLEESTKFNGTVILGVGGSDFDEIKYAIDYLKSKGKDDIFLMHGFQNYPTNYKDINFMRMDFLSSAFSLPIGYADHTDPFDSKNALISCLPQVMGYNVLEKHYTISPEKRIDSQAAVSLNTLKETIALSNEIFLSRGKSNFVFSEAEKKYGNTGPMKKAIVARNYIKKGTKISISDLAFKRTETSSSLRQMDTMKLIGSEALIDIEPNTILDFSNLGFQFNINDFSQFYINQK